jgi:class 3 adenylate cyclase
LPGSYYHMHPDERRLLAVLIADVVGYSRLMATDEAGTYTRVRGLQRSIFQPATSRYRGSIVKWTGDGYIATFPNAVDAVRAAADVQASLSEANAVSLDRVEVRIGVNLGDVILVPDDVYGDAVNIAARLQALADAGGIVVSRSVMDSVKSGYGFLFESAGLQSVKNIPEPIDTYRVNFEASGAWRSTAEPVAPGQSARRLKSWHLKSGAGLVAAAMLPSFYIGYPQKLPFGRAGPTPKSTATIAAPPRASVEGSAETDKTQDQGSESEQAASFSTAMDKEIRIGRSWQLDPKTCEARSPPDIVITHPPASGRLETRPVEFALRRSNSSCTGHFVKGVDVVYVPNAGFSGTEKVSYRVTVGKRGADREVSIAVK